MGKGGNINDNFSWEEVKKHSSLQDPWVVVEEKVYNLKEFASRHPGGTSILAHYAGQDATEAFREFHKNRTLVDKYMKPLCIGNIDSSTLAQEKIDESEIKKDFEELRKTAQDMGLFTTNMFFYFCIVGHLIFLEILAYTTLLYFGNGWIPTIFAVVCLVIMQSEASWSQHDFGHMSVFKTRKWNRYFHIFVMNVIKGASASWWNHMHNQHHSKPNVIDKDPDVALEKVFVLGTEIPKRVAKEQKITLPYNWQHKYYFIIGPPILFPIICQIMVFKYPISKRNWADVFFIVLFYVKLFCMYVPIYGLLDTLIFYLVIRILESHWYVWVTQASHVTMDIDDDKERPWLALQLNATCNVEKSTFNDWFTGHLNFQIEHHCFPTMPRHNLHKLTPLLLQLCKKHNLIYKCKTLPEAFGDIVKSLKNSGEIWLAYYNTYNLT